VVQSRVEDLSPVVKKVSVELTPDRVEGRAGSRLHLRLPHGEAQGYRQGHVPRRLVERYFGDDVKKDVAQKLVTGSIHEALAEHQLDPVAPPRVENGSVEAGQPFKYTATVEVRPRVEPKDYEGLSVTRIDATVTDAQVGERVEEMRANQAMFVPIEGRDVAETGDFVSRRLRGIRGGRSAAGREARGSPAGSRSRIAPGEQGGGTLGSAGGREIASSPCPSPTTTRWRNCAGRKRGSR